MCSYYLGNNSRKKTLVTTNNERALISLNVEIKVLSQKIKELKLVIQELIDAFTNISIDIPTPLPIEPPVELPEEPTEPEEPINPEPPIEPPIEPPTEEEIRIIEVTEEFYTTINLWLLI